MTPTFRIAERNSAWVFELLDTFYYSFHDAKLAWDSLAIGKTLRDFEIVQAVWRQYKHTITGELHYEIIGWTFT